MTIRDVGKVVQHWHEGAASDLRSAELLSSGKQWLQALFFCHLAIEKTLKAIIVESTQEHAPYMHNLEYLAGKASLSLSKEWLTFLEVMNPFNLEGRYPSHQATLRKQLTLRMVADLMQKTREFVAWCKKHS